MSAATYSTTAFAAARDPWHRAGSSAVHPASYAFHLVVAILLIPSRELVVLRLLFGDAAHRYIFAALLLVFIGGAVVSSDPARGICLRLPRLHVSSRWRAAAAALAVFGMYLVGHELALGDSGTSVKYAASLVALALLSFEHRHISVRLIARIYTWFAVVMAAGTILQVVLLAAVDGNDLTRFEPVQAVAEHAHREDAVYSNPYYLGLMRHDNLFSVGPLEFHRACGYSTEPKYYSVLLWAAVVTACAIRQSFAARAAQLAILGGALFLSLAYSSLIVIVLAALVYIARRHLVAHPNLVVLAGGIALIAGTNWVIVQIRPYVSDFSEMRVTSLEAGYRGLGSFDRGRVTLFGTGVGREKDPVDVPAILQFALRYGAAGVILYSTVLVLVLGRLAGAVRSASLERHRMALALDVSVVSVFFLMFMADVITMLVCLLLGIGVFLESGAAARREVRVR